MLIAHLCLACKCIDELWGAKPNTQKGDELDVLMLLVEKYEDEHYAIPASDPVETIKLLMEQNSLLRKDLEPYIGPSGRVSEVFAGSALSTIGFLLLLRDVVTVGMHLHPASEIIQQPEQFRVRQAIVDKGAPAFRSNHPGFAQRA